MCNGSELLGTRVDEVDVSWTPVGSPLSIKMLICPVTSMSEHTDHVPNRSELVTSGEILKIPLCTDDPVNDRFNAEELVTSTV